MARLIIETSCSAPFDWSALLDFYRPRALSGVEVLDANTYRRTFANGRISVARQKSALAAEVDMEGRARPIGLEEKLRKLFDLDARPRRIGSHLGRDPLLAYLVKLRPGLRVPGCWDGFELGVRAILGQQVSVAAASTFAGRIAQRFGSKLPDVQDGLSRRFPLPADLADADLSGIGLTASRAATVTSFARAIARDPGILSTARPLDDFVENIVALRGIGSWTAHYIAMRMGYADAFPSSDLGVRKALNMTSETEILLAAERWRPYRAYATMHLWASLAG